MSEDGAAVPRNTAPQLPWGDGHAERAWWTILSKKYGSAAMVGKIARGAYVLVVGTMVVAWVISVNKEAPAKPQQTGPQVSYMYS